MRCVSRFCCDSETTEKEKTFEWFDIIALELFFFIRKIIIHQWENKAVNTFQANEE